jgi:hypothetical protein
VARFSKLVSKTAGHALLNVWPFGEGGARCKVSIPCRSQNTDGRAGHLRHELRAVRRTNQLSRSTRLRRRFGGILSIFSYDRNHGRSAQLNRCGDGADHGCLVLLPRLHCYRSCRLHRVRSFALSELSQIRKDVDEARQRVSRQRKLIRLLREGGRDTRAASSTLTSMLETLRLLEKDEQQLEDERYRAA